MSKQKDKVLELMTESFLEGIESEDAIDELAMQVLHEEFNLSWDEAEELAKKYVTELWTTAEDVAEQANQEAREAFNASYEAYMEAVGCVA